MGEEMGNPEETRNERSADNRSPDETSKKTLKDIEETESSVSESPNHDPGPSPDGLLDEPDELKEAGPM